MDGIVVTLGLIVLVGLAVGVGMLLAGERHHRRRLRLDARSWELWRWEQELVSAADCRGCPGCELLRRRAELLRSPFDGA